MRNVAQAKGKNAHRPLLLAKFDRFRLTAWLTVQDHDEKIARNDGLSMRRIRRSRRISTNAETCSTEISAEDARALDGKRHKAPRDRPYTKPP